MSDTVSEQDAQCPCESSVAAAPGGAHSGGALIEHIARCGDGGGIVGVRHLSVDESTAHADENRGKQDVESFVDIADRKLGHGRSLG